MENTISLEDIVAFYTNPPFWKIAGTYIIYCLTIGTIQCKHMARKSIKGEDSRSSSDYRGGEKVGVFFAQIFAPLFSVFYIVAFVFNMIAKIHTRIYFKEWE